MPVSEKVFSKSANFPLEPLLSNSSYGEKPDDIWTYFLSEIPRGAAGGNIHIQLTSDTEINYEVYARFGGLPSIDIWDYFYANSTRSSDGSMFFMMNNSSKEKVDFYILYAREGIWGFGLRHLNTSSSASKDVIIMSISLERCPKSCSSHGDCKLGFDASGLTSYRSYVQPSPYSFYFIYIVPLFVEIIHGILCLLSFPKSIITVMILVLTYGESNIACLI